MKLLINQPFELDVELVDQIPKYVITKLNWVSDQTIDLDEEEMSKLLIFLNFCSPEFNCTTIKNIDNSTLSWG